MTGALNIILISCTNLRPDNMTRLLRDFVELGLPAMDYKSRVMTKTVYTTCKQQRRRFDCALAWPDQRCLHI